MISRRLRLLTLVSLLVFASASLALGLFYAGGDSLTHWPWEAEIVLVTAALTALLPERVIMLDYLDRRSATSSVLAFALVLIAPIPAVITLITAQVVWATIRRRPWWDFALTLSATTLGLMATRLTFCALTDYPWSHNDLNLPHDLAAAATAGVVFFLVETGLTLGCVAGAFTRPVATLPATDQSAQDVGFTPGLRHRFRLPLAHSAQCWLVDLVLALMMISVATLSPLLIPLCALGILIVHRHFPQQRYALGGGFLHDPITGLPNRAYFHIHGQRLIESGEPVAVLVMDYSSSTQLHNPSWNSDTVTHTVIDLVTPHLLSKDIIARLDDTCFAFLIPLDGPDPLREAEKKAQALLSLANRVTLLPALLPTATSDSPSPTPSPPICVGISVYPLHGSSSEVLLARAEAALRSAQRQRKSWQSSTLDPNAITPERESLLHDLILGMESDQLELRYQPKLSVATGAIVGVEALARWQHPRRGLLGPDEFIPLAETGGLMSPLTLPLLDKALAQTALWMSQGWELNVAVNLSATHLTDRLLPNQVAQALARQGVPARQLTLEVTESSIMNDPEQSLLILHQLRELGINTAIDDFGTGYSSLSFLQHLQVDELKIDASFIKNLSHERTTGRIIVAATIDMAHQLGLTVVAEGVENYTAREILTELKCDLLQGFSISRPQSPADLTVWLQQQTASAIPKCVDRPIEV